MRKWLAAWTMCLALAAAWMPALALGWSDDKQTRADALIRKLLPGLAQSGATKIPAAGVGVSIAGDLVFAKGYGEASPGVAADADTLFHVGSISKQFTAATLLHLIANRATAPRGQMITLDMGVRAIFEGIDHWTVDGSTPITVRSLLNMTSNLPNFTRRPPSSADPWGGIPAATLFVEVKKFAPHGWPGTFEYSNTGYFVLAEIIEAAKPVTGGARKPYREHVREHVFAKAGMAASGFAAEPQFAKSVAQPNYRRRPAFIMPDWLMGSADAVSNITDLNRWNRALMEGRILDAEMRRAMFADGGRIGPQEWYGMGWFVEHRGGRDIFSHTGTVPGYTSLNAIVQPGKGLPWISVTILTSSDGVDSLKDVSNALVELILAD